MHTLLIPIPLAWSLRDIKGKFDSHFHSLSLSLPLSLSQTYSSCIDNPHRCAGIPLYSPLLHVSYFSSFSYRSLLFRIARRLQPTKQLTRECALIAVLCRYPSFFSAYFLLSLDCFEARLCTPSFSDLLFMHRQPSSLCRYNSLFPSS